MSFNLYWPALLLLLAIGCTEPSAAPAPDAMPTGTATVLTDSSASTPMTAPQPRADATSLVTPATKPVQPAGTPTLAPTAATTPEGEDPRLPALRELTIRIEEALIKGDPLAFSGIHALFPPEFQAKCDSQQFVRFALRAQELDGVTLEDATYLLDKAWIEGDTGYAEGRIRREGDGRLSDLNIETDDIFAWSGGQWLIYVHPEDLAMDNPCDLGNLEN